MIRIFGENPDQGPQVSIWPIGEYAGKHITEVPDSCLGEVLKFKIESGGKDLHGLFDAVMKELGRRRSRHLLDDIPEDDLRHAKSFVEEYTDESGLGVITMLKLPSGDDVIAILTFDPWHIADTSLGYSGFPNPPEVGSARAEKHGLDRVAKIAKTIGVLRKNGITMVKT